MFLKKSLLSEHGSGNLRKLKCIICDEDNPFKSGILIISIIISIKGTGNIYMWIGFFFSNTFECYV